MSFAALIVAMLIHRSRVFDLYTTSVNSRRAPFEYVSHRGSCAAILLDPNDTIGLIAHDRPAIGKTLFELPAGTLDYEAPLETIMVNELKQETGLIVRQDQLQRLSSFYTSPGYTSELLTLFLVHVTKEQRKQSDALRWFAIPELFELIRKGDISDMKTAVAITSFQTVFWQADEATA